MVGVVLQCLSGCAWPVKPPPLLRLRPIRRPSGAHRHHSMVYACHGNAPRAGPQSPSPTATWRYRVATCPNLGRAAAMVRDGSLRLGSLSWSCNTSRRRLLQQAWCDVGSWQGWTLSKRELPRTTLIGSVPSQYPLAHGCMLARILPRKERCGCGAWMACRSARLRTTLSRGSPRVHDRGEYRNTGVRSTADVSQHNR
jgi:hypothetical protein